MIDTSLHKPTSVIHREVFVFSVIPVIQADLNEFMRTQNCRNIHKSPEAPGGVPEMLFNLPAIVSFPKKGTNISKEIKRMTKKQSLLLNIPLILIKKYMSHQCVIQKITN